MTDDDELIAYYRTLGPKKTAEILGVTIRRINHRRAALEKKLGIVIAAPNTTGYMRNERKVRVDQRLHAEVKNGIVLVGSDAHYWPDDISTAHRAFVKFCHDMKPSIVVMNGDVMDGARISRHSRIGWDHRPSVEDEVEVCKERLGEIRKASPKKTRLFWPLGNHDARFETRLANHVPEYARVHGFKLQDHFPFWEPCWSVWINNEVVIKHRFKSGIHAPHNNTKDSGKTMLTGHLHSLKVMPWSDLNGTRFGVDTGTLMEPWSDQTVDYTEDNPVNWRSGFPVLTFKDGELLWPEICHVIGDGKVDFRGEVIEV